MVTRTSNSRPQHTSLGRGWHLDERTKKKEAFIGEMWSANSVDSIAATLNLMIPPQVCDDLLKSSILVSKIYDLSQSSSFYAQMHILQWSHVQIEEGLSRANAIPNTLTKVGMFISTHILLSDELIDSLLVYDPTTD